MSISIADIAPYQGDQKQAFEELVCQIVRRTRTATNNTWVRLHGAGGDGGVEAYWTEDNIKHGIQAKWFLKTGEIAWDQIEKSFKTALKVHPDLNVYHIYIACDLTGPTARKTGSGKPYRNGVQLWDEMKARLLDYAEQAGKSVKIQRHTLSDVISELARPQCIGLTEFWFNEIELTSEKLSHWFDLAKTSLGERYHPEDHVDVAASSAFAGLLGDDWATREIKSQLPAWSGTSALRCPKIWEGQSEQQQIKNVENMMRRLSSSLAAEVERTPHSLPFQNWRDESKVIDELLQNLFYKAWPSGEDDLPSRSKEALSSIRHAIEQRQTLIEKLNAVLRSRWTLGNESRSIVFTGPAGIGKSHLLADAVGSELSSGGTAVFLLGDWLDGQKPAKSIIDRLGHSDVSIDQFLGALDARAASIGRRAVLVIDALNETAGQKWVKELEGLVRNILRFPHLGVAVSCRDVYAPYVLHPNIYSVINEIRLQGFTTDEEQEQAARQYLDKRGIVRPSLPWLAPEFSNPLFLRSSALALSRKGETEFPRGLIGTKQVFAFFIDSVGTTLGTTYDQSEVLLTPLRSAMRRLAEEMATARSDSLPVDRARGIVDECFTGYTCDRAWLEVLCRNNLLDQYPEFVADPDPFNQPPDFVRFVYQRLQDHLMSEALVAKVQTVKDLFTGAAVLAFLVDRHSNFDWRWAGLRESLSIQIPEKFGHEFYDVFADFAGSDHIDFGFKEAFVESIRWRDPKSISGRTIDLFNELLNDHQEGYALLIELCLRDEHPLNVERLHQGLSSLKMPQRDAVWTKAISKYFIGSAFERLVRWSANAQKSAVPRRYLYRAAVAVTWMLTSTCQYTRDSATKALSSLYIDDPSIFVRLSKLFESVDDPYVLERLFASAYGYLLRSYDRESLSSYSAAAAQLFSGDGPPTQLYLRDYARSIVDLADRHGLYDGRVPITQCRPPYKSPKPVFNATKDQVQKTSDRVGGAAILRSSTGWGDFKRYELDGVVRKFVNVGINEVIPPTPLQRMEDFEARFDKDHPVKQLLLQLSGRFYSLLPEVDIKVVLASDKDAELGDDADQKIVSSREVERQLKSELKSILEEEDYASFKNEWLPGFRVEQYNRNQFPRFDSDKAGYWVARRAFSLGWNEKRFPNDAQWAESFARERPGVERIGKKYQWLARSELIARLADNFWLGAEYDEDQASHYKQLTDLGFERDIDPSLFDHPTFSETTVEPSLIVRAPEISPADNDDRFLWPFSVSPAEGLLKNVDAQSSDGTRWTRLAWYAGADRKQLTGSDEGHGLCQRTFYFLNTRLASSVDAKRLAEELEAKGHIDIHNFSAPEHIDHPYLYENGQADTWLSPFLHDDQPDWPRGSTFKMARPVEEYAWESHLDKTLTSGFRTQTLPPWWLEMGNFRRSTSDPDAIISDCGKVVARYLRACANSRGFVVNTGVLETLLAEKELELVSILVGEREAWYDGAGAGAACYRRFNAIGIGPDVRVLSSWNEDTDYREKYTPEELK